jgi:hypothetical protein
MDIQIMKDRKGLLRAVHRNDTGIVTDIWETSDAISLFKELLKHVEPKTKYGIRKIRK